MTFDPPARTVKALLSEAAIHVQMSLARVAGDDGEQPIEQDWDHLPGSAIDDIDPAVLHVLIESAAELAADLHRGEKVQAATLGRALVMHATYLQAVEICDNTFEEFGVELDQSAYPQTAWRAAVDAEYESWGLTPEVHDLWEDDSYPLRLQDVLRRCP